MRKFLAFLAGFFMFGLSTVLLTMILGFLLILIIATILPNIRMNAAIDLMAIVEIVSGLLAIVVGVKVYRVLITKKKSA